MELSALYPLCVDRRRMVLECGADASGSPAESAGGPRARGRADTGAAPP